MIRHIVKPAEWRIQQARASLEQALAHSEQKKRNCKTGPQSKPFTKCLIRSYALRDGCSPDRYWNVAVGAIEPGKREGGIKGFLKAAPIIPQQWGRKLRRRIFGEQHIHFCFYGPNNGLILPDCLRLALEEWAIVIVPDLPEGPDGAHAPDEARRWAAAPIKEFKWRVLKPHHHLLHERISTLPDDMRTGLDLHNAPLRFVDGCTKRPAVAYLYFWHCCAVLDRYRYIFRHNFRMHPMPLEEDGAWIRDQLGLPPGTTKCMAQFWREVIEDVQRLNLAPKTVLDWRMKSKYLPREGDVLPLADPAVTETAVLEEEEDDDDEDEDDTWDEEYATRASPSTYQ